MILALPIPLSHVHTLVIIPTYNEAANIGQLIERIFALYPAFDILIVDDSSPDGTAGIVRHLQPRYGDHLHVVVRGGKGGRGSAVVEGCRWALQRDYDLVFEMDADFSHRPEEMRDVLECIRSCDVVVGSRYLPGSRIEGWSRKRALFSRLANGYARTLLRIPITDYTNGFRCYTRKALQVLDLDAIKAQGYIVLSEIAYQLHRKGMRIREVPTIFVNRRRGASNLRAREIYEAFFSILLIRWR